MPTLTFENRVWLPESPFDDTPWLALENLSPSHRAQLHALLRATEPSFPIEPTALASLAYSGLPYPLRSLAECPLECWNITEDGALRYRIWINGDGARFFVGDGTERAKNMLVSAGCFDGEGSLAARLEDAQKRACALVPKTELRTISFVSRA